MADAERGRDVGDAPFAALSPRAGMPPADVDWADLRLFLEVARTGSFSAAARKFGIEQSTVSRRVRARPRSR
ncbi:LysR family transcriptional regulator [Sorangium sp. So ce429]